ncbi:flagellar hook-associated protein 1 FlgK [Rhodobacteraceae bacterium MBR-64]
MSLTATLSNALSGLTAASRRAEVVSSNVANAATPGYGRQVAELTGNVIGGQGAGVVVATVRRDVDQILIGDRRLSEASLGAAETTAAGLARIEAAIGAPDEPGSLGDRIARLESSLISAASLPESESRQASVLDAAAGWARGLAMISDEVQTVRMQADAAIARDVDLVNTALSRVQQLNTQIRRLVATAGGANALKDQRQQVIDSIAPILPLREVDRGHGQVALFTPGGAIVLDGPAANFSFTPSALIVPGMVVGAPLSGVRINGVDIAMGGTGGALAGGRLAANFALRDAGAPGIQAGLDGLAADLLTRFEAADTTRPLGAAGLFTDAGAAFDPAAETGLAGRVSVNALVDPARGGAVTRLRDGLGAVVPGPTGFSGGLQAMVNGLAAALAPASAAFSATPRTASALAADFLSGVSGKRVSAEADQGFASARHGTLKAQELAGGVDTDAEMADLLRIEQAYSANARVLQTVDELLQSLLRI